MPSFIEIQRASRPQPFEVLLQWIKKFQKKSRRNILLYYSGFLFSKGSTYIEEEDMEGFMNALYKMDKSKGVDLFLHTPGGSVTTTESIGEYLKSVFNDNINCYVPHMAMSCGTLLAMASKTIYMGKQSSLGPIDPAIGQYRTEAIGEEFERAKKDIARNPNFALLWQPIISKYPMTFIGECEKASQLAASVSEKWLRGSMLKGDHDAERKIATILQTFASHMASKVHDRHIPAGEASHAGLNITMIEDDPPLQDLVMSVHHSAINFMKQSGLAKMIINKEKNGLFIDADTNRR